MDFSRVFIVRCTVASHIVRSCNTNHRLDCASVMQSAHVYLGNNLSPEDIPYEVHIIRD